MREIIIKPPVKTGIVVNGRISSRCFPGMLLPVGEGRKEIQSLLQFDLAELPLLAEMEQGVLALYLQESLSAQAAQTLSVHQILSPWRRGCPLLFQSLPAGQQTAGDNMAGRFIYFDITRLVRDWQSGAAHNFGLLLRLSMVNGCGQFPGFLLFAGRSAENSYLWPSLRLSFAEPVPDGDCCRLIDADVSAEALDTVRTTAPLAIQRFNYTYFVINAGPAYASASLQLSPDGENWLTDIPWRLIAAGEIQSFVPGIIARYARLAFKAALPGQSTRLDIRIRGVSC